MKGSIVIAAMITAIGASHARAADFTVFLNNPSNGTAVKICSVVVPDSYRNDIMVPVFWFVEDCNNEAQRTKGTRADLGCLSLDHNAKHEIVYSFMAGSTEAFLASKDANTCGWEHNPK